jgi:hypothetical protein
MNTIKGYVIGFAVILALAGFPVWRHWVKRVPLIVYVIGVAIAWAVVLGLSWFIGGPARFNTFILVCLGFWLGMLAMYIAVHVYKS